MDDHPANWPIENIFAELRRLGLDPEELQGLAVADTDGEAFLAHLARLERGATWSDVFAGTPKDWRPSAESQDLALGPFDYPQPPRGAAVFASMIGDDPPSTAASALQHVESLGVPLFGSGIVLDRGAPHLYVVLKRGASEDEVMAVAECLRSQQGIGNSYPVRSEISSP